MDKDRLLKNLKSASRGNFFSIEIPAATKEDETKIFRIRQRIRG